MKNDHVFYPHSLKQQDIIFSDHTLTLYLTGIQVGKTTAGAYWMKRKICAKPSIHNAYIIVAPNYKTLQQSTLPAFLKLMEGLGTYHVADSMFKMDAGAIVYLRTATEPDSIVGITNVQAIWGDEAGKFSLYFWENIQSRASFKQAPILLTTTPYTSNWLFKEIVRPYKAGKLHDTLLISACSNENPYFPQEEYDKKKQSMDPRRFAALYEGQFEKMQGLVYDCWDEETGLVDPFQLPQGTRYYGGIDWGYTEPFVLSIRAITPNGYHYQVSEFYKSGLTIPDIVMICKQKKNTYDIKHFYAGPDRPENIEELNRNGITCLPANNDIRLGVDMHYELIKTGKFKIFKGSSPHTIDELDTYHYPEPEEIAPNKSAKELNPVGQNDHALDSARYITVMTYKSQGKIAPKNPEDIKKPDMQEHQKRLKFLMKNKKERGHEIW